MTVSVCIPTYNSAQYLRECISSVLNQTYSDFEIVVSDNASTDGTCDVVRSFCDSRIRLRRLEPFMGMAANFNNAASLASGELIKFLCYDDLIDPDCLRRQVIMMERHPELVLVTSGLRFIDAAGRTLGYVSRCSRERILADVDVIAGNLVYGNMIGLPSAVLIRRGFLAKAGPFSEAYPQMMDVELYLRLIAFGPVGYLPEPLCANRLHERAMTMQFRRLGVVREDMRRLTALMLRSVVPSFLARRVAWGRVAGSFLSQAGAGFAGGHLRWPATAVAEALRIDPGFIGLAAFLLFFRTGFLGLGAKAERGIGVRLGRTPGGRA